MKILSLFIIIIFFSANLSAASERMTVGKIMDRIRSGDKLAKQDILSTGSTLEYVSLNLEVTGREKLFCTPDNVDLNGENYFRIVEKYLEKFPDEKYYLEQAFPLVVLAAFKYSFPCK